MSLIDGFKRTIDYFRISVTDRCNLRCLYCMPSEGVKFLDREEILRYEEIVRIVRVATKNGITKVRLTGGEPLIRKGIPHLIRELSFIPEIIEISLTTNGVLLKEHAHALKKAGLNRINVSLDSLKREKYTRITRGDNLPLVWEGIKEAEAHGFSPIKINVVPIRGLNDDEILDFAVLTLERPIHVRFIEFMPLGCREIWEEKKWIPNTELKEKISAIGKLSPVEYEKGPGPAKYFKLPGAKGVIGFISALTEHFCSSCNRLRLTADGKLRPCLSYETEIDLKTPLRAGCNDDEIERLFNLAIQIKPEQHHFAEDPLRVYHRTMSKIGG